MHATPTHSHVRAGRLARVVAVALGLGLIPSAAAAAPTEPGMLVNPLFPPSACDLCHSYSNALSQSMDPDYAPVRTWQGSLMANSARDPVFWAGLSVADQDAPGQTELCIRCHAPRAFLDGHGDVTSIDGLLNNELEGVECELCHRSMDDGETPPGNARYTIDDVVVGTNVPRRGPWDFTDGVPEPPHSWIADPFIGSSRMCGTCHDVTTESERVDDAGVGLGVNFNEQRTYSEWLGSAYAVPGPDFASCQDCHMPAVPDMPGCTSHANQWSHPEGGRRHDLVGANRFMIELIKQEYGAAGANLIPDSVFEHSLEATDAFVQTAATLEVEAPAELDLAVGLQGLEVTVTNNTGHKLPTGYSEGRVMWLEIIAEYGGERIYSSGAWEQGVGFERDPQLRTYEGVGERWSDGTTFHLLLNDHWVHDTRIPPRGLVPDLETDPVGDRYTLLPDGTWPHFDRHSYAFDAAPEILDATPEDASDDVLAVTVRLRYLINTAEYIDFLAEAGGDAGNHVATLFDLAGGAPPVTLAEQVLSIPIVGFGGPDGTTTTTDGSVTTTGLASSSGDALDTSGGNSSDPTPPMRPESTSSGSDSSGAPAADDGEGSGCGCRSDGAPAPLGLLPLLLLGLGRRRRSPRA